LFEEEGMMTLRTLVRSAVIGGAIVATAGIAPVTPPASAAALNVTYITAGMVTGTSVARAYCPKGGTVTGGGGISLNGAGLSQSYPISDATGVIAWGSNAIGWQVAASDWSNVQAFVVCVGP
jgi:hypothetical protein